MILPEQTYSAGPWWGQGSSKAGLVDLVAAYSNWPDVLGDLECTLAALTRRAGCGWAGGRARQRAVRAQHAGVEGQPPTD